MNIDELQAGSEMDEKIAELMGHEPRFIWIATSNGGKSAFYQSEYKREVEGFLKRTKEEYPNGWKAKGELRHWKRYKHYSEDMAAAWEVRVKMEELGWISKDQITWMGWGAEEKHPYGYSIWFEDWSKFKEIGDKLCFHAHVSDFKQAPLAICRAALKAMGADK